MKKIHLIIVLISLSITSYCQQFTTVSVSNNVSLLLPNDYEKMDTLGTRTYTGTMPKGMVSLVMFTDIRGNINDEKELSTFFKEFQKGMLEQVRGTLISETVIEFESVKINKTIMITTIPNMIQWNGYTFRLNSTTYSIQFIYPEKIEENLVQEQIIKSLKISKG